MITGLAIGAFIGTILGYALCAMMVVSKRSDELAKYQHCNHSKCNKSCPGWNVCDDKW